MIKIVIRYNSLSNHRRDMYWMKQEAFIQFSYKREDGVYPIFFNRKKCAGTSVKLDNQGDAEQDKYLPFFCEKTVNT